MQDSEKDNSSQSIRSHRAEYSADSTRIEANDTEYAPTDIQLPPHNLLYTLIIGVLGGMLATAISVAITFMNASLYQEASRLGDKMSLNTAWTITGLGCLDVFIDLLLSFAVGYLVGRKIVLRRRGLLAGALVGAIISLGGFLVHSLPIYPDKLVSTTPSSSSAMLIGILAAALFFLIYSAVGALIALWGVWAATRQHPYYQREV
jgi:hypothetical protein